MQLLDTKVVRGPNYWSDDHTHLVLLKIKAPEPAAGLDAVRQRLLHVLPSLQLSDRGNLAELLEAVALELQQLAGLHVAFGFTRRMREEDVYVVGFSYQTEETGLYAADAARWIVEDVLDEIPVDAQRDIAELKRIDERYSLGPTTLFLLEEAAKHGIPYKRFNGGSLVTLGYGTKQQKMRTAVADTTSGLGMELAGDKDETKELLAEAFLPVPRGVLISTEAGLRDALRTVRFPLVIKPLDGNHGRGVTTNITTEEKAIFGFHHAKEISDRVIVEEFIEGQDHRFLVINFKLRAVARRTPAMVTGDGGSTIQQLIDAVNADPLRGDGSEHLLAPIRVDEVTLRILDARGLTLESVLPEGELLYLKDTANISAGGTSTDVTELVHPDNVFMAERVARLFNLDICGIDVMMKDVRQPLTRETGAIIEVNAGPGLRMHSNPGEGQGRNVAKPIMEMLFPGGDSRIPVVAVSGTNGKTTTVRLIAHLAKNAGHKVGYTTSDGIYIRDHLIHRGDCTGPSSAQTVLFDPTIDYAVLECARGGILRAGLGFDRCDISVITNLSEAHLGVDDVHTLEEMAKVKAVLVKNTSRDGYAVLNADNDLVYDMRRSAPCSIALFSTQANNKWVRRHCEEGGLAAIVEDGYVTICKGLYRTKIGKVAAIPLSLEGRADFMVENILAAVLVAVIQGMGVEIIRKGLSSFTPSAAQTPGRMNLFRFRNFVLMIDHAHTPQGFAELKKFFQKTKAAVKVGIISASGDSRDEDIRTIGRICAQMFDEIIIRSDRELKGRTPDEIARLLLEGIRSVSETIPVEIIPDELEALSYAIGTAKKGAFIFECADAIEQSLEFVQERVKEETEMV